MRNLMNRPLAMYKYLEKPQRTVKYSKSRRWGLSTKFLKNNNYSLSFCLSLNSVATDKYLNGEQAQRIQNKRVRFDAHVCSCVCACVHVCVCSL